MKRFVVGVASHGVLVAASIVALYPILWVLKMALTPGGQMSASASIIPSEVSYEHFHEILGFGASENAGRFWTQCANSFLVAGSTTLVSIGVSCMAAYGFARLQFVGRDAGLGALMLTQIFPGVVMMVPLYIILDHLHLVDSLVGLVVVYCTTAIPFCTWMLKGYFESIPLDIEEAAMIDGAQRWVIFFRLVLPLARPAIAVTALFSFMTAWNEFVLAATLLNDPSLLTLPVGLQRYVGEYHTDWGAFAAGAVMTSLPVMALFYVLQRHLVGGLTAAATKG